VDCSGTGVDVDSIDVSSPPEHAAMIKAVAKMENNEGSWRNLRVVFHPLSRRMPCPAYVPNYEESGRVVVKKSARNLVRARESII
jgi:hypothetical protein